MSRSPTLPLPDRALLCGFGGLPGEAVARREPTFDFDGVFGPLPALVLDCVDLLPSEPRLMSIVSCFVGCCQIVR